MFDVVPPYSTIPSSTNRRRSSAPRRTEAARRPLPKGRTTSSQPVVKLEWQLPARLRRPVREELARERTKQRRRQAIVQFERRPIYSELPTSPPHYRSAPAKIQPPGVEQHTADVYRNSPPDRALPPPPYQGRLARQAAPPRRIPAPARPRPVQPSAQKQVVKRPQPPRRPAAATLPKPSPLPLLGTAERDVPFDWQQLATATPARSQAPTNPSPELSLIERAPAKVEVRAPKRRFALPLHFSIFPRNLLPARTSTTTVPASRKKKLLVRKGFNITVLLVGCGVLTGAIWLMQGAGRGVAVGGSVAARAQEAFEHVLSAQSALAETDFAKSEQEFAAAEVLLQAAQQELSTALAASEEVLKYLDVTGTVRSGHNLLTASEELTVAGQHVSRGIVPLLTTDVFAAEENKPTMVDALSTTIAEFTAARDRLAAAETALQGVSAAALPTEVGQKVDILQEVVPKAKTAISAFLDQSDSLLTVLGAHERRQYLLLFQNNHELRPTGGFIGSIALLNVDRGTVEDIDVQTVYDPDGQLKENIAPPAPLLPITNRWFMRDANWFIDYSVSAQKVASFFEKEGGPTVDGVITITPEVIKRLLSITGPIKVPGYDITVTPENFVTLTQDQVTYSYDRAVNRPKQFLADLTPLLLNKVFAAKSQDTLRVLNALHTLIQEKQLLMYFRDAAIQEKMQQAGWDGSFPREAQGFLLVNNANIGGHKSDQFVEQEIDYRLEVKDDSDVEVVLTIRRTHRGPEEKIDYQYPPGEDPAFKDNVVYQRVLVPRGAELLEAQGFTSAADIPRTVVADPELVVEADLDVAEWQRVQSTHTTGTTIGQEAGYTSFANWQITKPGATTVGLYRYRLPQHAPTPELWDPARSFTAYIAKQPGDVRTTLRTEIKLPAGQHIHHTVPSDGITPTDPSTIVYRGQLRRDALVGAVYSSE
ncbi:MAG: DUF4012 domain-containing protein [Candidatus Andersenbacteria bacterium]